MSTPIYAMCELPIREYAGGGPLCSLWRIATDRPVGSEDRAPSREMVVETP
jgi:hypothetical protein